MLQLIRLVKGDRIRNMNNAAMLAKLRRNRFLIVGRAGLDLYADPPGTTIEAAGAFKAALGGSAANIATALSLQGADTTLLTRVSNDAVGRFVLDALSGYGVNTRYITVVDGEARTSMAVVETRSVNCQSVIYRNHAADFQLGTQEVEAVDFNDFDCLIFTGTALALEPSRTAVLKAIKTARALGVVVVMDIDYRPYSWASPRETQMLYAEAAEISDIVVGNDEEFAVLANPENGLQFAKELAQHRLVVYKMGERGCITFSGADSFETPVFPVATLKPTGAGDGFMGGFLAGLALGQNALQAVRRGAATAAIVVTRVGCAPAMPNAKEVDDFLIQHQH
jgi:5-dehydro-2-deoxygluconokinase